MSVFNYNVLIRKKVIKAWASYGVQTWDFDFQYLGASEYDREEPFNIIWFAISRHVYKEIFIRKLSFYDGHRKWFVKVSTLPNASLHLMSASFLWILILQYTNAAQSLPVPLFYLKKVWNNLSNIYYTSKWVVVFEMKTLCVSVLKLASSLGTDRVGHILGPNFRVSNNVIWRS